MNRDLKFRAICEYEHNSERFTDMIYFGMQTFENGLCVFPEHTDKIDYINEYNTPLMQFTGLLDKNGKEIYEGDILEDVRLDGSKRFYKVFYKKGGLVINIHQDDFKKDNPLFYEPIADMQTSGFIEHNCTIIGNIYENPELLSGGEK